MYLSRTAGIVILWSSLSDIQFVAYNNTHDYVIVLCVCTYIICLIDTIIEERSMDSQSVINSSITTEQDFTNSTKGSHYVMYVHYDMLATQ